MWSLKVETFHYKNYTLQGHKSGEFSIIFVKAYRAFKFFYALYNLDS